MKLLRAARCEHGCFASFSTSRGFLMIMLRPRVWRCATIRLQSKPGVTRYYVGPVEVEVSNHVRRPA